MNTSLTLLGLLGPGPGHGYDLKHSYDRWFGTRRPLAFGQVYATLARLVRDGSIVATGAESGGGPERKRYAITDAGRERVSGWMFTPESMSEFFQSDLFAKTVIALMMGDDAGRLLDLQRTGHLAQMRELTRLKKHADLSTVLLADHALFHLEADLRWIDLTAARLGELRAEVVG